MSQFVAIRNGGKTDENGALRFLRRLSSNGQGIVQSADMQVTQHSTGNKSVDMAVGDLVIAYQDYIFYTWIDATYNLSVAANTSGNTRKDAIVAYVDLSVVSSASSNNPGALKFMDVQGTPSGSPIVPDNTAIQAAVGAGNPFYVLGYLQLTNSYVSVLTANITDARTTYLLGSGARFGFAIPGAPAVGDDVSWNPPAPAAQTVTTLQAHCKTAPVGSGVTIRIYNITQGHAIASVTIADGATDATSTSMTNASIAIGDVLRMDITAQGSSSSAADISALLY